MFRVRHIAVALLALYSSAQGQGVGRADFYNGRSFMTSADRLVRDVDGVPLVGTNYLAQLYYGSLGSNPSSLDPVDSAPAPFRPADHVSPGTWRPATGRLTGFTTGDYVTLQVRVWDGTIADSYEAAAGLNFLGTQHGISEPFSYLIPSISSPASDFYIENFRGFTLVPEPSLALLTIAGFAGLYFARRGRR